MNDFAGLPHYRVMADAGRLDELQREFYTCCATFKWEMDYSSYLTTLAKVDDLRQRIRVAKCYLASQAYADDLSRGDDWIAR